MGVLKILASFGMLWLLWVVNTRVTAESNGEGTRLGVLTVTTSFALLILCAIWT